MSIIIGSAASLGIESSKIRDFYSEHWPRQIALSNKEFYDWQFLSLPDKERIDSCHIAVSEQTMEIAGVMGLNERPFNLVGKTVKGAELTTWIVSEKFQGLGVGAKMLLDLQSVFDVLIGMNISDAAIPVYLKSGFRFTRQIPRFFRIYDFDRVEAVSEFTPLARKVVNLWKKEEESSYSVSAPSEEDVKDVNESMKKNLNYFSRNSAFIDWRYTNHPFFNYNQILIKSVINPKKKLIVVFRMESTNTGLNVLHVMDLLGDLEMVPAAISYVNEFARKNEIDLADFYCTFPAMWDYFFSQGWFSSADDHFVKVPNLFQPLELRHPQTSSLIFWGSGLARDVFKVSRLYVTKQDCDLDRPTMYFIENN